MPSPCWVLTIVCCALTLLSANNCLLCPHLVVAAFHQVLFYGDRVLDVDILVELLRGKKFQLLQSPYIIIKIVHLHPISTYVTEKTVPLYYFTPNTLVTFCESAHQYITVFCLGFFCRARRPAPFSWRPALLKNSNWRPALLSEIFFFLISVTHGFYLCFALFVAHTQRGLCCACFIEPFKGTFS